MKFKAAQLDEHECQNYAGKTSFPTSKLDFDQNAMLARRSQFDGAIQTFVPTALRERVIKLTHENVSQGHAGQSRVYENSRQDYCLPFMESEVIDHVSKCKSCIAEKGMKAKKQHNIKLFPPTGILEDIEIDLFEPLSKTNNDNQLNAVITD